MNQIEKGGGKTIMATCPVCENTVDEAAARAQSGQTEHGAFEVDPTKGTRQFHDGKWYYFDSLECRSKFMAHPDNYLKQAGA
jgi:YHS domain-containing protein